MDEQKEIQKAVRRYLEKVAAELANVSTDEKDAILQGVESRIHDAFAPCGAGHPPGLA